MNRTDAPRPGLRAELAFCFGLALLFLAACVAWVYHEYQFVIASSAISLTDAWAQAKDSPLPLRLAGFAAAVLALHLALGWAAFGLARLTRAAQGLVETPGNRSLIAAWFLWAALLVLAANAAWFPASRFATLAWLRADWAGFHPATWMLAVSGLVVFALAAMAAHRQGWKLLQPGRPLLAAVAVAAALLAVTNFDAARSQPAAAPAKPDIVIIGVDSLRPDLSEVTSGQRITPHIDRFLGGAHRFSDAITPLARTYPAWISILTGRHPVSTNTRFNLMPRALVDEGDTLADALRERGYRTVFATDEVRFANIDESFGFDQLIAPPIGASDFLLGTVSDLPLVNLMAGTRAGAWLLPGIHSNRADYVSYRPSHFLQRLDRELDLTGPAFLAIHLTLAHWPYTWAENVAPTTPQTWRPAYRDAIAAVDGQFGDVIELLRGKGVLDNAIVVVLSDHGDALGYPSDSMLRKTGTSREIWDSLWGHGTSVMSPHQYGVLLAMRAYGRARMPGAPGIHGWPVSLEDVRPTLEQLAFGRVSAPVDGLSLVPYLEVPERASTLAGRIRFTETCFNTVKLMEGKVTASGVAQEAAAYFEIEPRSGWVQLRQDRLGEIMAHKQRAALSGDAILAAIPSWTDDSVTYLYSSRQTPLPRSLSMPPDPKRDPEAFRLWGALVQRFPGELETAAVAP